MTRRGPAVRSVVSVALLLASASLGACTDDADEFCDRLADATEPREIAEALAAGDVAAAEAAADGLEELAKDAPREVRGDLEELVEAVRRIISTHAATGAARTESVESLNPDLAGRYSASARNVAEWANGECGLDLR